MQPPLFGNSKQHPILQVLHQETHSGLSAESGPCGSVRGRFRAGGGHGGRWEGDGAAGHIGDGCGL